MLAPLSLCHSTSQLRMLVPTIISIGIQMCAMVRARVVTCYYLLVGLSLARLDSVLSLR